MITNAIAGRKYTAGGSILVNNEIKSFPASGNPYTVTIDSSNPTPVINAIVYID